MDNKHLRRKIVDMVMEGKDGHIPSAFSIVDIIAILHKEFLKFNPSDPKWKDRDYFILSKGHGCLALYVVLHQHGLLTDHDLKMFCKPGGILGEHPDTTKIPFIEASTGSLGHGFPFSLGIALGLKIRGMKNKVFVLVGDGECHEGTIWEAAHVARNRLLGNICVIVDWNSSAAQLMPYDNLPAKWKAFGWSVIETDGHSEEKLRTALLSVKFDLQGAPTVIIAKTTKGKGVTMLEGHGPWHHKIPNKEEYEIIMKALT